MNSQIHKIGLFHRKGNRHALIWVSKIKRYVERNYPFISLNNKMPDSLIVLGGDGTILKAARKFHNNTNPIILGLNIGNVGFLASVRKEKEFLKSVDQLLQGKYSVIDRMMITSQVRRKNKIVFTTEALNEIVVKNPLGMVDLRVKIAGQQVKQIRGTGILVATATGSTAYNLSAHGPIVMPDIKCFIITDILDHSIPSPSVVVKYHNTINIRVVSYRQRGLISLSTTGKKFDVLLVADGESVFPLEETDEVIIKSFPHLVKFAELEKNYFFKSLQEKFGFK